MGRRILDGGPRDQKGDHDRRDGVPNAEIDDSQDKGLNHLLGTRPLLGGSHEWRNRYVTRTPPSSSTPAPMEEASVEGQRLLGDLRRPARRIFVGLATLESYFAPNWAGRVVE